MARAAFFDLDKTILDTSSNVALSGPFIEAGLMTRRTAIASVLVQLPYLLAGAGAHDRAGVLRPSSPAHRLPQEHR